MIKKLLLNKSKFLIVLVFLFAFYGNVNAQCSITSSTSSSSLTCGTFPLISCGGTLYVGNGTDVMTLTINSDFNLECLGAINLVVNSNATIVFGTNNNDKLTLKEYSTITIKAGGNLSGGKN
ncbi:MAG: hypothetical protein C0412_00480, partial [Flavobacterium sp.]|nr:hypothetical protein [Flavobacterium sp.]